MDKKPTLLLSASDVTRLLELKDSIVAVEEGFRVLGEGRVPPPQILGVHSDEGGLHIKAAVWNDDRKLFIVKANSNFPANHRKYGLPTIQGVIVVSDATNGQLLALVDSIEITAQRTAAASAVAAKYLARSDSKTLAVFGCGRQGIMHVRALAAVLPITTVYAHDPSDDAFQRFTAGISDLHLAIRRANRVEDATRAADVIATCTPSTGFFIRAADIRPGTFIAAVGADNEHKHEIDPELLSRSTVVVDNLQQCATIGDLHHALEAGTMIRGSVHAELAEIVCGRKAGRTSDREITVFDSTGIAIEDAAATAYVLQKAIASGIGQTFAF